MPQSWQIQFGYHKNKYICWTCLQVHQILSVWFVSNRGCHSFSFSFFFCFKRLTVNKASNRGCHYISTSKCGLCQNNDLWEKTLTAISRKMYLTRHTKQSIISFPRLKEQRKRHGIKKNLPCMSQLVVQQAYSTQFHQHISSVLYKQPLHCYTQVDIQIEAPLPADYYNQGNYSTYLVFINNINIKCSSIRESSAICRCFFRQKLLCDHVNYFTYRVFIDTTNIKCTSIEKCRTLQMPLMF